MNILNKKIINIFEYIIVLFIVLQSGSVFNGTLVNVVLQILFFLLFIKSLLKISNENNSSKIISFLMLFTLIMSLFLLLNFFVNHYSINYVFFLLFDPIMLITYFYSCINKYGEFNHSLFFKLENIIIVLALSSLLLWVLATLGMQPNTYVISYWGGIEKSIPGYFHLFYTPQGITNFLDINMLRNSGIFQEAPMYAFVLSMGLLIELFIRKSKILNYRAIILFITIFTTTSTTGVIIAILSISYLYFTNNKFITKLILLLCIPLIFIFLKILILDKINGGSSYDERIANIVNSYNIWKNHLIIGNGMGYDIGSSTGIMSTLASGGIILVLFYIIPTFGISKVSYKYRGLAIFSFILYIFTIITNTNLYILFLSYFWIILLYNKKIKL